MEVVCIEGWCGDGVYCGVEWRWCVLRGGVETVCKEVWCGGGVY